MTYTVSLTGTFVDKGEDSIRLYDLSQLRTRVESSFFHIMGCMLLKDKTYYGGPPSPVFVF